MPVTTLTFTCRAPRPRRLRNAWGHAGVVASGDLEVLLRRAPEGDAAQFTVRTKVSGFAAVWQAVLERFVSQSGLAGAQATINDQAATPPVVLKRLEQALQDAGGLEQEAAP